MSDSNSISEDLSEIETLTVTTDKLDYAPGETATITVTGVTEGAEVVLEINDDPSDPGDDGDADIYQPFSVTDGGAGDADGLANGTIVASWYVPTNGDPNNATLNLLATEVGSGATGTTTFTDSAGSYSIKWYAADPQVNSGPLLPTYDKLSPSEYLALNGTYPSGRATDPLANAEAYKSPATSSNRDAVTSLAPADLALGQIVPFFIEITVNGSTSPENGIIKITPEWLTKTTSGGNFGFDPAYGVVAAFVDAGDPGTSDPGNNAQVNAFTNTVVNAGTSNEAIRSEITVAGLNNNDKVIVEVWVVLKGTIPAGVTGNVQTSIANAVTGSGSTINTGNQTVPLNKLQEFFTANADLSVIKSDNAASVTVNPDVDPADLNPGDTFTYTIVAKNNSTSTVSNGVVVTDTLDANVTFVSASNSGSFADNGAAADTVSWNLGALSPGETVTLTVTVQVKATAPTGSTTQDLLNSVSITSITADSNTANNSNTEPTDLLANNRSLKVVKTAVAGQVADAAGEVINYTITVENTGNVTLTGVTVSDPNADIGPTYVSGDIDGDNKLDVDETWTYSAGHTVTQAELDSDGGGDGDLDNTATADSNESASDSDDADVPVDQTAGLMLKKEVIGVDTAGDGILNAVGDKIDYRLTVSNTGNTTLTNVTVQDPLTGLNATIAALAVGASHTIDAQYSIALADLLTGGGGDGDVDNTARADSDQTDPVTDSKEVPITQLKPCIDVEKYVSVDGGKTWWDADCKTGPVADSCDNVLFKFVVKNTGELPLDNVTVSDSTLDLNGAVAGTDWSVGALGVGESRELCVQGEWQYGQHTNVATAKGEVGDGDSKVVVHDQDDANYFGINGTLDAKYWISKVGKMTWDGKANPKKYCLPEKDLLQDTNGDNKLDGLRVGDFDFDGKQDPGEDTIVYSQKSAIQKLGAKAAGAAQIEKQLVAAWLNMLNGNSYDDGDGELDACEPAYWIDQAIQYVQACGPKSTTKAASWLQGIDTDQNGSYSDPGDIASGAKILAVLTQYNADGSILSQAECDHSNAAKDCGCDGNDMVAHTYLSNAMT